MIFSPVTAGLWSLMTLGRIGLSRISVLARKVEIMARLMSPVSPLRRGSQALSVRRNTISVQPVVADGRVPLSFVWNGFYVHS